MSDDEMEKFNNYGKASNEELARQKEEAQKNIMEHRQRVAQARSFMTQIGMHAANASTRFTRNFQGGERMHVDRETSPHETPFGKIEISFLAPGGITLGEIIIHTDYDANVVVETTRPSRYECNGIESFTYEFMSKAFMDLVTAVNDRRSAGIEDPADPYPD